MKKTLTITLLLFSISSMAQVNWAVQSIDKPTDLFTKADSSTDVTTQVTLVNKGATVPAGDTITLAFAILRASDNAAIYVSNNYTLLAPSDITSGQTIQTNDINLNINVGVQGSVNIPIKFLAISYVRNRSNPIMDTDSTDNILVKNMDWKPLSRASVLGLTYNQNISAYPNPANTELTVSLGIVKKASTTIELINLNGQTVLSTTAAEGSFGNSTLDVTNVEKGLYVLRVTNGDLVSTTKVSIAH